MVEQYRPTPEQDPSNDLLDQVNAELTQKAIDSWREQEQRPEFADLQQTQEDMLDKLYNLRFENWPPEPTEEYSPEIVDPVYASLYELQMASKGLLTGAENVTRLQGSDPKENLNLSQMKLLTSVTKVLETLRLPGFEELKETISQHGWDYDEAKDVV